MTQTKQVLIPILLMSLLAAVLLVACDTPVMSGYVYGKHYSAAYSSYYPGYTTESCVHSGKYGESCYPVYHPAQVIYHPAEYYLALTTCQSLKVDDPCKTGWVSVDEYTFDHIVVGGYYLGGN